MRKRNSLVLEYLPLPRPERRFQIGHLNSTPRWQKLLSVFVVVVLFTFILLESRIILEYSGYTIHIYWMNGNSLWIGFPSARLLSPSFISHVTIKRSIPACSPHCVQRALTVAPSVPLVKTLFTERMCLYLLCVFRERKISSLSISLNLITFQNYAFSGCLCHSFPSLVHYGWTCDGCFDVAFPSPPPPAPNL